MLSIDRMQLRLPAGYEHRATGIAHQVGALLGKLDTASMASAERVSVGTMSISAGANDSEVAEQIAAAILKELGRGE